MANNDMRAFLNSMRTATKGKTINENTEGSTPLAPQAPTASSSEAKEEEKAFTQAVGMAYFGNFSREGNNVNFQGALGSGETIKWHFSLADGCVISTQQFTLDDENFAKVEKLKAYFDIWKGKWQSKLTGGDGDSVDASATSTPVDTSAASQGGAGGGMNMGMGL